MQDSFEQSFEKMGDKAELEQTSHEYRLADMADQAAGVPADHPDRVARNQEWGDLCEKLNQL